MRSEAPLSLNEVETLAAKAARGAGAPWGVAEDLARASRWLAERNFDWSGPLLRLLERGSVAARVLPALHVADLLATAEAGDGWVIEGCQPVWVVSLLAVALHGRNLALTLVARDRTVRLGGDSVLVTTVPLSEIGKSAPAPVEVAVGSGDPLASRVPAAPLVRRSQVAWPVWQALERYAARTYVPATAQSRQSGAGGSRVDAD